MKVLVLNPGSSTLKFQLFDAHSANQMRVLVKGVIDRIGTPQASMRITQGDLPHPNAYAGSMIDAAGAVFHSLKQHHEITMIGYRVVHGGDRFKEAVRISSEVLDEISSLGKLAPLHNAAAAQCIAAGLRFLPDANAVAVFDTSYHRTMPDVARRYAIPREFADQHQLYRFGFHGISHQYIANQLVQCMGRPTPAGLRLITCHLGNGASICAIRDGKSIDTSMGLTPLEGLIMGTRSGDVDPGLVLHLVRTLKMSADDVSDLLNDRSGLLGLSGRSGDVRNLEEAARAGDVNSQAALEAFAYRSRKYLGAYAAALGGVDGIAFTGGVGEHSSDMRERIVRGLEFLGVRLDPQRNRSATGDSSASIGSGEVSVWVIPTDEERQVALETFSLCADHR